MSSLKRCLPVVAGVLLLAAVAGGQETARVSVDSWGNEGNAASYACYISGSGRFVAFESSASNLVPVDDNGTMDVFVRDLDNGRVELLSVSTRGVQANSASTSASISANGRVAVFQSYATNLVDPFKPTIDFCHLGAKWSPGQLDDKHIDTDGLRAPVHETLQVYGHDRKSGLTFMVSVTPQGKAANAAADQPFISPDGRYVTFRSRATDLVNGVSDGRAHIFLRDLLLGTTEVISVGTNANNCWQLICADGDSAWGRVSEGGRWVAFSSKATNLVPGDVNGVEDVFLRDRLHNVTTRISVPAIPIDAGPFVGGKTFAPSIVYPDARGLSVYDHGGPYLEANGASTAPSISYDGRFVAFQSLADNLVPGDDNAALDVFVRDRITGVVSLVSIGLQGGVGDGRSYMPVISPDGEYVRFTSEARNLVPADTNGMPDTFLRLLVPQETMRVSIDSAGQQANGPSLTDTGGVSYGAGRVVFCNGADNLVVGDTNQVSDVFGHRRETAVYFESYGEGLEGSGGYAPNLFGIPGDPTRWFVRITAGLGGAHGMLVVGLHEADLPIWGGRMFVDPSSLLATVPVTLSGAPIPDSSDFVGAKHAGSDIDAHSRNIVGFGDAVGDAAPILGEPGTGELLFRPVDLTEIVGATLYMQAILVDPGAVQGKALTNALRMQI